MRRALDRLYAAALVAAAFAMVAIAVLVLVQIGGRLLDRVLMAAGEPALGIQIPSLAEIGGFLFVASSFLALAGTLRAGGHVRVTLLAGALPAAVTRGLTALVLAAALGLALFATWHAGLQTLDSWQFDSKSFGMIAIPLWIPQGAMTLGLVIFAVALLDELATALRGASPAFVAAEAARGPEAEG